MKASEILNNFLKGSELATISEKQKNWLVAQCKSEGICNDNDIINGWIDFEGFTLRIKQCSYSVSAYGGGIGKRYTNRFKIEKMYKIKFLDTGLTDIRNSNDLAYFKSQGHQFEIN